jgi:dTDP-4-amino-4,6-dideoxygalactose transaminase
LVPALTFAATVEAVLMAGARPLLVDVEATTSLLSLACAEQASGGHTRAVIFVNLYGQSHSLDRFWGWSRARGLRLISDAAQAHGGVSEGQPLTRQADVVCYSFHPSKNLGACGDAGAAATDHQVLALDMAMCRDHGRRSREGDAKHRHERAGFNFRMDELQAAVLKAKLPLLTGWTERRREIARFYLQQLADLPGLTLPGPASDDSVWHLFVVECEARDELARRLHADGIDCRVPYPVALDEQPAFARYAAKPCLNARRQAACSLALPVFEGLRRDECEWVVAALRRAMKHMG